MAKDKKGHGKGMPAEDASSKPVIWACSACGQENEAAEEVCCACEEPRPSSTSGDGESLAGYVVGLVTSSEPVPKKDRLAVLKVDIGAEEELQVVTNAPNVVVGSRVVVATVGAAFRGESGEDETVRKGSVGGVMSSGMICNAAMLGWKGGDNKAAVILPDTFPVGSKPPESRPRKE